MATSKASKAAESTPDTAAESSQGTVATRALDVIAESIVKRSPWDETTLRELNNFDAAIALAAAENDGVVLAHEDLGDGFALLDKRGKDRLVGVPLLFMEWHFNQGDFGGLFCSARVVARNNDGGVSKYILNDGGAGIAEQLASYTARTTKQGGLIAKNGLRRSDYTVDLPQDPRDPNSPLVPTDASTYYIDLSA